MGRAVCDGFIGRKRTRLRSEVISLVYVGVVFGILVFIFFSSLKLEFRK